ncbi:hypothetical protein BDV93DRAFT_513398 [Ceratobasidium sp. AG-I]|nr:hypothetical protein BDV93DRAFT_513398 [Ceratobasidium sp. AG-I]
MLGEVGDARFSRNAVYSLSHLKPPVHDTNLPPRQPTLPNQIDLQGPLNLAPPLLPLLLAHRFYRILHNVPPTLWRALSMVMGWSTRMWASWGAGQPMACVTRVDMWKRTPGLFVPQDSRARPPGKAESVRREARRMKGGLVSKKQDCQFTGKRQTRSVTCYWDGPSLARCGSGAVGASGEARLGMYIEPQNELEPGSWWRRWTWSSGAHQLVRGGGALIG